MGRPSEINIMYCFCGQLPLVVPTVFMKLRDRVNNPARGDCTAAALISVVDVEFVSGRR
ncbi:Uncharacterised protein [Legionella pneumophila]|nr:Uncharacterised protein [Legionella pneumophila]